MNTESNNPTPDQTPESAESGNEPNGAEFASGEELGNVEFSPEDGLGENGSSEETELSELETLKAKLAEAEKRVLLGQADLENFRRRNRRDTQEQIKYASLGLIGEILESVDNLHRAVEAYELDPNGDGLVEGVKMVAQQISTALESKGCRKIEAVGTEFDPNCHQAVQMQASDEYEANIVMMDMRPGFLLHDRVVRPSQVFVSTGPAKEES